MLNKEARQNHSQMQDPNDKPKAAKEKAAEEKAAKEKVTDPVCGMDVTTGPGALRLEREGHVYYFCSAECREQYEASPDDFDG